AEWNGRFTELCDRSTAYLEAARHALLRLSQLVQRIDQARAAGFEAEAQAFVGLAPLILDTDLLDSFEAELERVRDRHSAAPLRRSAPQPSATPPIAAAPSAPKPKPADKRAPVINLDLTVKATAEAHPPPAEPNSAPQRRPPRPLLSAGPPGEGERQVEMMRPNVELPEGVELPE